MGWSDSGPGGFPLTATIFCCAWEGASATDREIAAHSTEMINLSAHENVKRLQRHSMGVLSEETFGDMG